jgi:hypothetical protein
MNHRTSAYFDDLAARAAVAPTPPRTPWSEALPNACHTNCEVFVRCFLGYELVCGRLAFGGCWFVPNSTVRETATHRLTDITPVPSGGALPFVEHRGAEEDFAVLRKGRDGSWLHPQPADMLAFG